MNFPFDPKEGLIVVPTRLRGPTADVLVQLALDTGATGTMVNWDAVMLLGYDPAVISERIQMTTGSGIEFAPRIMIEKIEAWKRTPKLSCSLSHLATQRHSGRRSWPGLPTRATTGPRFLHWIGNCRVNGFKRGTLLA